MDQGWVLLPPPQTTIVPSYNPYTSYYSYNEATSTYEEYEPTPVSWSTHYSAPTESLYYWD
jgi:hypothetical protein